MPRRNKFFLAAIFVALSFSTIAWNIKDRTPPPWDPADHISAGYDYYHSLAHGDFATFTRDFFASPHYYAPLVHLTSAALFLIFGATRVSGIFVNLVSLGVLLVSVEWLARRLYCETPAGVTNSRIAGAGMPVVAALLATSYHFPAWLLHDAFLDYPLIAIVTASIALLVRAGDFSSSGTAAAFGVAAGLGALTKQTYPFFLWLPFLYAAVRVILKGSRRSRLNLLLALTIAAAVAAIWYVPHANDVIQIYRVNRQAAVNENEAPLLSFLSLVNYLFGLASPQIQVPFALLFVASVSYTALRRRRETTVLYLWLISGILTFTFIANKDMRYTVPVLPAAALISTSWISDSTILSLCNRIKPFALVRLVAITAIVLLSAASFVNAQWPRDGMGYYIDMPRFRWMVFARNYYGFDHRPFDSDWGVPAIVRTVAQMGPASAGGPNSSRESRLPAPLESVSPRTFASEGGQPLLGVVVNLPHLNPSSIALYARLMSPARAGAPVILVDWLVTESALDRMEDCDYVLVRTGLDGVGWVAPVERVVEARIKANPMRFEKVASFTMPREGTESVLYRVRIATTRATYQSPGSVTERANLLTTAGTVLKATNLYSAGRLRRDVTQ